MMLKINDVVSYKVEDGDLLLLKDLGDTSELSRLLEDLTISWKSVLPKSYDFLILNDFVYITTKDSEQTFVLNKYDGSNLKELSNLVLHVPVAYQSDNYLVAYASLHGAKSGILFDTNLGVISKINPDKLKVTKVINQNSFLSFDKGILNLVKFLTSSIVWSIDLLREVTNRSSDKKVKLIFLGGQVSEDVMVISLFNTKSNNQYLFGLDINTGLINWCKEGVVNFGEFEKRLYSLKREGKLEIYDIKTGLSLKTKDLSKSFRDQNIKCSRGCEITSDKLFFKDEEENKLGAIDIDSLELEFVQGYPKGVNLPPNEYPKILGEKMILYAPLNKELYLIDLEYHPV